ncbi:bacteriocin ABC transporter ATP-binding protein [Enterococcus sp. JM4C]|uniref:ATP-binding cassette domain-containing protein n=1 Tax=Candidatus Enterococcus huntleyi TaxID=1857217 RepID=UPI001379648E|nr:ATP-binding cassette domain-containing protein [Enterococcus sp. JM4C]KAF1299363.1 bacteriocin ABC transporter ATP-binding protein [Enterococcus sp. JM4C]
MIEAIAISKKYGKNSVIREASLKIEEGEFVAITGESGKGKTTLMNIISLLDKEYMGTLLIDGRRITSPKQIRQFQRVDCAYLFQNYALIENETIAQNLEIATKFLKNTKKRNRQLMTEALAAVGLELSLNKKIYELSGGEQQRVALARAYLKKPKYLFADEPTGNLDEKNRDLVLSILKKMNENGTTIVMVTHDLALAEQTNRIITIG